MRQSQKAYEKLAESMSHGTPEERERVASVTEYQRGREDMRREVVEWARKHWIPRYVTEDEATFTGYNEALLALHDNLTQLP